MVLLHRHFATLVKTFIPEAEKFHSLWRETVYGEDCFGHPVVGTEACVKGGVPRGFFHLSDGLFKVVLLNCQEAGFGIC